MTEPIDCIGQPARSQKTSGGETMREFEYDLFVRPFPHCPQCVHYPNKIDEDGYHYCHMCVMEYDCFKERN